MSIKTIKKTKKTAIKKTAIKKASNRKTPKVSADKDIVKTLEDCGLRATTRSKAYKLLASPAVKKLLSSSKGKTVPVEKIFATAGVKPEEYSGSLQYLGTTTRRALCKYYGLSNSQFVSRVGAENRLFSAIKL